MKHKIGILCAGDREAAPFIPMIADCKITEKAMLKFYEGKIEGVDIVTLFSGVCKVNAAIAAQILIDTYGCSYIINAGTAGGMDERLDLFDIAVSTETAYHDVAEGILTEFHPWLDSVNFKSDEKLVALAKKAGSSLNGSHRIFCGRMVTGETFIEDDNRPYINEKYAPLTVDMESASVAHVCHVNRVPFVSIRTITDTASYSGAAEFEKNCEKASRISADLVRKMLQEIAQSRYFL